MAAGNPRRQVLVIRTTTTLTSLDVVRILAACAIHDYAVRVGTDILRRDANNLVRTVVATYGHRAGTGWDAGLTDAEGGPVIRWAADQARRHWPQLSDHRLTDYVARYALPLAVLDLGEGL